MTDRSRRSVLAVPGSSPRMIEKSRGLAADEVMLDLEDAVAPGVKAAARAAVVAALGQGGWAAPTVAVRVNDLTTPWTYRDVIDVVEGAGAHLDCIVLPKVTTTDHVRWLDLTLGQVERAYGLPAGRIGIEAQIEDAAGLRQVDAIAAAADRLEALVFGPLDFTASLNMRAPSGEAFTYARMRILTAARARGLQAIDGPFVRIHDEDGLRAEAARSAALGYDGKWVLHPGQIAAVNEAYVPDQEAYDRAERILDAYAEAVAAARGAVLLGDEMIDEASRRMAQVIAAQGRAAGLRRREN